MRVCVSMVLSLVVLNGINGAIPAFAQASSAQPARPSASACNMAELSEEIRQNPRNVNALVTRGACDLMPSPGLRKPPLRNVEAAIPDLETALRLDPQNYYAHHNYAQAAYLLGFDDFAIAEFTKAITLNPKGARSFLGRGWAYSNLCQLNEMATDFAQAVRLDPNLRYEVASPGQIEQHRRECSRPPAPAQAPRNCPKANIFAFSLNARFVLQSEWQKRHPGCPL
ncbi:MAG: tetratricopeptide repeat protein [Terriglobia bacterium]